MFEKYVYKFRDAKKEQALIKIENGIPHHFKILIIEFVHDHKWYLYQECNVAWNPLVVLFITEASPYKSNPRFAPKAAFRRAKFLCHILHAEQSFLTLSFDTIRVNQFSPMEFNTKSQLKLNI